ncbi:MAG: ribosomal protein S18-alanine N-acetyltransferase [Legionellales bacterium]|nr:ribosomal protein S18-alanine N-acetyltransferase [Legionellales bacterium]
MPINIRVMQAVDVPVVAAIENAIFPFPWGEQAFYDCLRVNFSAWVVEVDDELTSAVEFQQRSIVGYAIVMTVLDESELLNIAISPAHQGKQFGEYLLRFVLGQLWARGIKVVFLEVRKSNEIAKHLYQKLNFVEIGLRKDYYQTKEGREDAILYKCCLNYEEQGT